MSRAPLSKFATVLLALLAVMVPIVIALQGWALGTLLSIERRLTRLETLQGIAPGSRAPASTPAAGERRT